MKLPNMERLNTLWQVVNVAGEIRDVVQERRSYLFNTAAATTFYLRADRADVSVARWALAKIEVRVRLEAAFGWRIASDQDEAGVYIAAHRRRIVGSVSRALFSIIVPHDAYLILRLDQGHVTLENLNGTLQVPPMNAADGTLRLLPG